jgi:hypothetical protein
MTWTILFVPFTFVIVWRWALLDKNLFNWRVPLSYNNQTHVNTRSIQISNTILYTRSNFILFYATVTVRQDFIIITFCLDWFDCDFYLIYNMLQNCATTNCFFIFFKFLIKILRYHYLLHSTL